MGKIIKNVKNRAVCCRVFIFKFTFEAVKFLGLIQICLGLVGSYFVAYGLLFWALGFGVAHIVYGIYIYYRYEK